MTFLAGQSAVIIPVPEAEPVVGGWRARFDTAAAVGVPAHVTVVYPFLPTTELTDPVIDELRGIVADRPAFGVRFARCDRFPGVLFLAPEPDEPFRRLIADLVDRWPEAPPYGGEFADPVPHLTVADVPTPAELHEAERDVTGRLPVAATVEAAWLIVFDGELWRRRAVLPLGAPEPDLPQGSVHLDDELADLLSSLNNLRGEFFTDNDLVASVTQVPGPVRLTALDRQRRYAVRPAAGVPAPATLELAEPGWLPGAPDRAAPHISREVFPGGCREHGRLLLPEGESTENGAQT